MDTGGKSRETIVALSTRNLNGLHVDDRKHGSQALEPVK